MCAECSGAHYLERSLTSTKQKVATRNRSSFMGNCSVTEQLTINTKHRGLSTHCFDSPVMSTTRNIENFEQII